MGLDMYLTKETYIGNNHRNSDNMVKIEIVFPKEDASLFHLKQNKIRQEKITSIVEEVACWRKANYIHAWFVRNVQEGEDDCRKYHVSNDDLSNLVSLCKQVLENPALASELLPTQPGFFFGSTNYDEYYVRAIRDTVEMLEPYINDDTGYFYYESSW
jgi:hypothetical protein